MPAPYQHLPIWRDANRLLVAVEQVVRKFSRYHKYTLGTEMRRKAMHICQQIIRIYHAGSRPVPMLQRLLTLIEDCKLQIQLAKELKAFQNFAHFQQLAELAVLLGKQGGGWLRKARSEVVSVA